MKKIYLSLLAIVMSLGMSAQLNNLGLNDWTAGFGYDDPDGWTTVNQYAGFLGVSPGVIKISSNVSEGTAAAEMFTQPCSGCAGFGIPDTLPGALIMNTGYYSNTATEFEFDYQYEGVNGDWGMAMAELTVWDPTGDTSIVIAMAVDTLAATTTSWTTRSLSFVYDFPAMTPDTINIYFMSSSRDVAQDPTFPDPQDGSTLRVDNVKVIDPATASIEEIESTINVFAYHNVITISTPTSDNIPYEVVDLTGKIVMTGRTNGSVSRINGDHLRSGIYLVSVGDKVQKIIIE